MFFVLTKQQIREVLEALGELTCAVTDVSKQIKTGLECLKSHSGLATKQDLEEMESRLKEAITKNSSVTPAVQRAATRLGDSLDKLDATIPDRKTV